MWKCPECNQEFAKNKQRHSCNERQVEDFLEGKNEDMVELFHHFIEVYQSLGHFALHPTKSRIGLAARIRFGFIHRIGRDFIDIILTFDESYDDNFCFYRIGEVPGDKIYQHYLRLMHKDDINEEVLKFMKLALERGS